MMGAQAFLLPPSVPYRFFAGASVFHVVSWALLAAAHDQAAGFQGGPGPVLAALHALTIGVLASAAMGASYQMLPVATGKPLRALWPCRLSFWLLYAGLIVLLIGFTTSEHLPTIWGGGIVIAAFALFAVIIGDVYARAKILAVLVRHGWAALTWLVLFSAFGILLILDMETGLLPDHSVYAIAHMIMAAFGFMGLLAMGYAQIMIPMFALAPSPERTPALRILLLALAAILTAVMGALYQSALMMSIAAAGGLIAALIHIRIMLAVPGQGMRKNLGLSFILIRAGWGFLLLAIVMGTLLIAGYLGPNGPALFGFVLLYGWLLTFLLGILQRIVPFLATMNASKPGQMAPRPSEFENQIPLKAHAVCHAAAIILVAGGIAADMSLLILGGALIGLLGALAYLGFVLDVLRRMIRHSHKEPAP